MTIDLNPEQERAAGCLNRPVLVTAGAGSGKTRMLAQRFVNAVTRGKPPEWEPARLDQILAITFTDKAAGELAERLRTGLGAAGLRNEAREVASAWVSTIHGLCSRILRRHSFEADVDPSFVVLDSVEASRMRESAFQDAVGALVDAGAPTRWVLQDYDTNALFTAAVSVLRDLVTRGMNISQLELEPAEEARSLTKDVRRLFERGGITCDLGYSGTSAAPGEHAALCRELLGECDGLLGAELEDRELLGELMSLLLSYKPIRSLKGLEEIARELGEARSALCGRVAATLAAPYALGFKRLVGEFAIAYERAKRRAGALDFDDLQFEAVTLLERRPDLASRYRQQFRAVMVDEFQDTDALQLRLVELLSDGDLCTVGDEHQSIYRFRGADVDVYRAHRARMVEAGALVTELDVNYRSHPDILGFTNGVFSSGEYFGETLLRLESPTRGSGSSVFDSVLGDGPRVEAILLDSTDTDGPLARAAEAACVARRLREIAEAGVCVGDMAILLRTYSHADAYEAALSREGLPAIVVGGSRFFGLPEITVMRALNRAIANSLDDVAVGLLLVSDFAPVTSDALAILRFGAGQRDGRPLATLLRERAAELDAGDREVATRFVSLLEHAQGRVGRAPLAEVLLTAVEEAGWDLRLLSGGNLGRGAFANVLKFARQAEEFEASGGGGPAAFAEHLDVRERLGDTEAPASLADDGSPAVRIMSIHASKGLEFPIVCVPELAWQAGGGHSCVRTHLTASGDLALAMSTLPSDNGERRPGSAWMEQFSAADSAAEEQESARVLYVAFTRAQEALIVSGAMGLRPKQPPKAKHHLARVARALGVRIPVDGLCDVRTRVPRADTDYHLRILDASQIEISKEEPLQSGREGLPRIAPPAGPVIAERCPQAAERPSFSRLSYTQLEEFERCPKRFWVRRVLGVRPAELAGSGVADPRRFGIALHTALRLVRGDGLAPAPERLMAIAAQTGLTDEEGERLASAVTRVCASDLARTQTRGGIVRRETPFFMRVADRFSLAGSIDLYVRTGSSALVVDYKSGEPDEATDWERYRLQAVCYALAALRDGCDEVSVEFVRVEGETSDGCMPTVTHRFSAVDARAIEDELLARHAAISKSAFEPHPSLACQRCDVPERLCEHRRPGALASGI